MNPLTLVKRIQNINAKEASLGISEEASWHAKYKDSAYVFVGGIPFDLTEGDLLAVFAQYGEIVDVNLVRDKGTGKSKGFAFVAYEDQRSTNLAVDNLNGAQILGRIIRVDHVTNYKKKEEEDEEAERQKREARGICRAFQRGECTRGAGCKFSHDEQRAANTGWGPQDHKSSRWGHDKFEGPPPTSEKRSLGEKSSGGLPKQYERLEEKKSRGHDNREIDPKSREDYDRREGKRSRRHEDDEFVLKSREDSYTRDEKRSRRYEDDGFVKKMRDNDYKRVEKKSRRYEDDEVEPKSRVYDYKKEEKRSRRNEGVEYELRSRDGDYRREDDRSRRHDEDDGSKSKLKDNDFTSEEKRTRYDGDDFESRARRDDHRKEEKSFRRHDSESPPREDKEKRGRDSGHARDTSSHRYKEKR